MKTVFARLSIFDEKFLPVENPPEFLRAAKKRLGKPYIERLENRTIYTLHNDSMLYKFQNVSQHLNE